MVEHDSELLAKSLACWCDSSICLSSWLEYNLSFSPALQSILFRIHEVEITLRSISLSPVFYLPAYQWWSPLPLLSQVEQKVTASGACGWYHMQHVHLWYKILLHNSMWMHAFLLNTPIDVSESWSTVALTPWDNKSSHMSLSRASSRVALPITTASTPTSNLKCCFLQRSSVICEQLQIWCLFMPVVPPLCLCFHKWRKND